MNTSKLNTRSASHWSYDTDILRCTVNKTFKCVSSFSNHEHFCEGQKTLVGARAVLISYQPAPSPTHKQLANNMVTTYEATCIAELLNESSNIHHTELCYYCCQGCNVLVSTDLLSDTLGVTATSS
jgi:hypothetical protein